MAISWQVGAFIARGGACQTSPWLTWGDASRKSKNLHSGVIALYLELATGPLGDEEAAQAIEDLLKNGLRNATRCLLGYCGMRSA